MANPTGFEEFLERSTNAREQLAVAQVEAEAELEEVKARAKVDFNFYAGLMAPETMRTRYSQFYLDLFVLLTTLDDDPYNLLRFALGLPRGFVKTTFLKILTCYLIHYGYNSFVLVVCASEPKAISFIDDVDEMLSQPQIEAIYGRWTASKITDNAKLRRGVVDGRQVILQPAGAQSNTIRGSNVGHLRPDLIICDDIQTREGALSDVQNNAMIEWFTATLAKAIANYGSNRKIIFLGNMYPGNCLLAVLKQNSQWVSLVTGAILEDGESLWPELKPVRVLLDEYKHDEEMGKGHLWFAEVQNDPLDERYRLLAKPLPTDKEYLVEYPPDATFITLDPAGFRKKSDDNVATLHAIYDGLPVVVEMQGGIWNPKETIVNTLTMAALNGVSVIGVESVGYQQSLCYWMEYFIKQLGWHHIKVVELKTNNISKTRRIQDFIDEVQSGESYMFAKPRQVFTYYAHMYKIGSNDNRDDYLDSPAYQKQMLTNHGHLLTSATQRMANLDQLPAVIDVDIGIGV